MNIDRIKNRSRMLIILMMLSSQALLAQQVENEARRSHTLILNSYHKEFYWTDNQVAGIREVLRESVENVELYVEYMDTKRIYTPEYLDLLSGIYRLKYKNIPLDAIITTDDNALRFVMDHQQDVFQGAPVSFCGINDYLSISAQARQRATGVVEVLDIEATIDMALKLHPKTSKVYVIVDSTPTGIGQLGDVSRAARQYKQLEFEYLKGEDYSTSEMLDKLPQIPQNSIILLTVWLRDKNNIYAATEEVGPLIAKLSPVPVYGIIDMYLGHGIIGGKLLDSKTQGRLAAEKAILMLKGIKPSNIPVVEESRNSYMFDDAQLRRWGIDISDIPLGSIVIKRSLTAYETYRKEIWSIAGAFMFLVLAILFLAASIIRCKRVEEALRVSKQRFKNIFEESIDGIAIADTETGMFLDFNHTFLELVGWRKSDLIGKQQSFLHPGPTNAEGFSEEFQRHKSGEDGLIIESQILTRSGEVRDVEIKGNSIEIDGKRCILGHFRDITDRNLAEKYRRISSEILVLLNEPKDFDDIIGQILEIVKETSNCDAIGLRFKTKGDYPYWAHRGFTEDFLLKENSLLERDAAGGVCINEDGGVRLECTCGLVISGKTPPDNPLFTDGGSFWTNDSFPLLELPEIEDPRYKPRNECIHKNYGSVALIPIQNDKEIVGILQLNAFRRGCFTKEAIEFLEMIARNIAGTLMRRQAEEALKESESQFRGLLGSLSAGVVIHAPDTSILYSNKKACEILGLSSDQMQGKLSIAPDWQFLNEDGSDMGVEEYPVTRTIKSKVNLSDYIIGIRNSELEHIVWVSCNTLQSWNNAGELENVLVTFFDITTRKKAEEDRFALELQVQHAQKLESLGVLAGGIAHDFNNILAAILGFSEFARDDAEPGSEMQQNIDEVIRASNRAAALVQQILSFSLQSQIERQHIRLQPIIKEALKLIRKTIPSTIDIQENLSENCGIAHVDPTQIHQIIMNICTNAYHAMQDEGGVLTVCLDEIEMDVESVKAYENLESGKYAHLSISDTGHGMDKETVARIFEPYFTTKDKSKGSGLGLATVYGIIRNYQGNIFVHSVLGSGTTFDIYLPLCEEKVPVDVDIIIEPEDLTGNERIMFVDDEASLTRLARLTLEPLGYTVETFTSSLEAQEVFLSNPQAFDIVITDFTMPKMTGLKMATNILAVRPDIPIILCTGYSDSVDAEKAKSAGIKEFLQKPLGIHNLAKSTRQVLDKLD